MHIGFLTNDKSGPAFESPIALKAVSKLLLLIQWGKLQCCLNTFSCVKGKDSSKLPWALLRSGKFSCFIALDKLKMQQVPTSLRISREISHKLKEIESYLAVFPLSTLYSFKCCLDINQTGRTVLVILAL